MSVESNIVNILQARRIPYEVFAHEPVYTNPAMAQALGVGEADTVKSLVLVTKEKRMVVLVLPGDKRVDWKTAAKGIGTAKVSFAKPEQVLETVGCEVGCVPPFGQLAPLPVFMDPDLVQKEYVYFNPGRHDKSFKIKTRDLQSVSRPQFI